MMQRIQSLALAAIAVLIGGGPAIAATEISLSSSKGKVENYTITDPEGIIKVVVNYTPIKVGEAAELQEKNLTYDIFYTGDRKVSEEVTTYYTGNVAIKDIDQNGTPEVIVSTFSGGAHCCTSTVIHQWRNNQFQTINTGFLDGRGGDFTDLDGDGTLEFTSYDQSFLYRFSSYAGSFAPSKIFSLIDGQFLDTTPKYRKTLRSTAWKMYQTIVERQRDSDGEINGVLAGYVAQKALLGEFEEGWNFMLSRYDRQSNWGLDKYDGKGNTVGQYPDFPTALRAHLQRMGYIK